MKILRKLTIILSFIFIFAGNSFAHVLLDYPVGGESYIGGESITIQWHIHIDHGENDWDLYFSNDGGASWASIVLDLPKARTTYSWKLPNISTTTAIIRIVQDNVGNDYEDQSSEFLITEQELNIENVSELQSNYLLEQNIPNPFNPSTIIQYSLPEESLVNINIYNLLGKRVNQLLSSFQPSGIKSIQWNGTDQNGNLVPEGIYFYQLQARDFVQTKKMVLIK